MERLFVKDKEFLPPAGARALATFGSESGVRWNVSAGSPVGPCNLVESGPGCTPGHHRFSPVIHEFRG